MPQPDYPASLAALVARLATIPQSERAAVVTQILPLLADVRISLALRIAAAAGVLRYIPDRRRHVRRVTRALTAGVSTKRALDRLRDVQKQIEKCNALDEQIEVRELRVKLACPRCKARLPRSEMVKHLWHEHRLMLHRRSTRTTTRTAAELQRTFTATGDLEALDRMAELHGVSGLRRWMADEHAPTEEVAPLLEIATEHGAGLCPVCFTESSAAVSAIPPPFDLANGRLSGDGYAVRLNSNAWVRTLTVSTPDLPPSPDSITPAPRTTATLVAALIVLGVLFAPSQALLGLVLAAVAYLGVLFTQSRHDPDDRAVDVAWSRLAPGLSERENAVRFLTRLCLASLGRGNAEQRVAVLANIAARAAGRADDSDAELQLLAASRVLQIEDAIRLGQDAVAGVASLAATGFTGELSADFAEFVVGAYLTRDRAAGDLLRLRMLLLGAAFEAGLVPRDLTDIWAAAPNLKRVMSVEPANRLGLLFGLWRTRDAHAWHSVGHGDTVFDLARKLPRHAAGVLERFPDLLLSHRPERAVEDLIGPMLICARGVAIGDQLLADPGAEVRLESNGRVLIFGRHRIEVRRQLPDDFPDIVSGWLQFRAEWLSTLGEGGFEAGTLAISQRVLAPFCRRCSSCETVSTMGCGSIGCAITA